MTQHPRLPSSLALTFTATVCPVEQVFDRIADAALDTNQRALFHTASSVWSRFQSGQLDADDAIARLTSLESLLS